MNSLLPHRRLNVLTNEWILVSPQRALRPWLGAVEKRAPESRPPHDPACYLCAGNTRANGITNPRYEGVFVFDNDFPALLVTHDSGSPGPSESSPLLQAHQETGVCRVICFSPRHDLTLPELPLAQIRAVVDVWVAQCEELGARDDIAYVQLFENKGEIMGCSNPHPHGQLWATRHLPTEPAKEQRSQEAWLAEHGRPLLIDYVEHEFKDGSRVLFTNEHFIGLVPYWATWPFETMILPRQHRPRLVDLSGAERDGLAGMMRQITQTYDKLFGISFPYSMGVHQAPYDGAAHEAWQMHLHFYPPLLRSATVKKFLVGYEMLAQAQRDLTPEQASDRLRAL